MVVTVPSKRIDKGLSKSNILWRYLDMAKLMDFLENRTLFFSRADCFEDKYEGAFTKSLRHRIEDAYVRNNIDFSYEEFKECLRERVYINCWHKSAHDSMAMWRLYGTSTNSVAITTTVGRLAKVLERCEYKNYIAIRKVRYVNHWRDPELNIRPYSNIFTYKLKAYDYEKEVKVILDLFSETFDTDPFEGGIPIKVDVVELTRSVVVSPEAPAWFYDLVVDIVEKYELSAPVIRSKLSLEPV